MRNKTKYQKYYRNPRTTQERRANSKRGDGWGRTRRNQKNLVNSWDDDRTTIQNTWKVKRRHQYRVDGRGKKHVVYLPNDGSKGWRFWVNTWEVEEYFRNHDISYSLRKIEQVETRTTNYTRVYRRVGEYKTTRIRRVRPRGNGAKKTPTIWETYTYWEPKYAWVVMKLAKPRVSRYATLLGYELTWWSGKCIGIDYILQKNVNHYWL